MIKRLAYILFGVYFFAPPCVYSQSSGNVYKYSGRSIPSMPRVAIKSNLLYDATTTLNLGVEMKVGRKFTLDIPVNYNPWTFPGNRKWKHLLVQPEVRYWLCEPFYGHFLGVHTHYAYYNVGRWPFGGHLKEYRYEGWLTGGGVSYGYHWILSARWSLEAGLGVGYAYLSYDKYDCKLCGDFLRAEHKHYFGITKAAVSLIFNL